MIDNKISKIIAKNYWTNLYGMGRAIIAFGTLMTLLFNSTDLLFSYGLQFESRLDPNQFSLNFFFLFPEEYIGLAKILAMVILSAVVYGVYPRITGILHWYITYSFYTATPIPDGGDQIAAIITLYLIPITLTDSRKSHWNHHESSDRPYAKMVAHFSFFLIRLQMAFIYFDAAVAKFDVNEWVDGTAIYYWFSHPVFGVNEFLSPVVMPLLGNPVMVVILSWGVLLLELSLAGGLIIQNKLARKRLFIFGSAFHFMIIVIHGLSSFFFAMLGGLMLYLISPDTRLNLKLNSQKIIFKWEKLFKRVAS